MAALAAKTVRNNVADGLLISMAQYFFDFRSNGTLSVDRDGVELLDVETAHDQAVDALADVVRDATVEGATEQHFAVGVRDSIGPVLEVTAVFGSRIFRTQ